MRYHRDGALRIEKRTVVGSGKWFWARKDKLRVYPKASPVLHDEISQVVVNPSWTVPPSIVRQEFRPRIEEDPDWLEKKGYVLKTSANGHDVVVQPPGPNHTLGDVKMLFPNRESVYLHDTNKKFYFTVPRRDLSHGCVRVQDALDFAAALLVDDWNLKGERFPARKIHALGRTNKTYWYKLHEPIPVYLEYYTASVGPDGEVRFHPDVYEYDRRHFEGPLGRSDPASKARKKGKKKKKKKKTG